MTRYADRKRFAGEKHLRRFHAPSRLVIGMNLLVPAHRVFQPFTLGKTQRRFNLRAHVGFADSLVQVGHEHDGGNLLDQSAIFRFQIYRRGFRTMSRTGRVCEDEMRVGSKRLLLQKNIGEFPQRAFRFRQIGGKLVRVRRPRVMAYPLGLRQKIGPHC